MDRIIRFVKTAGIYFLGSALSKILAFVLLPLYSKALAQNEFGYFDLSTTLVTIVIGIVSVEIWTGIIRFLLDRRSEYKNDEIIYNAFTLALFSVSLLFLMTFVIYFLGTVSHILYIFLYALGYYLQAFYGGIARGFQKNLDYAVSGVLASLVNLLLNIIGLIYLNGGIEVLYLSFFASAIFQIGYLEIRMGTFKSLNKKYRNVKLRIELLRFCLPLCTSSISFWILGNYGKIVLSDSIGINENAIYSMALRFASVIPLVTTVISLAWQETVFVADNGKSQRILYKKGMQIYFNILSFTLIFLMPVMKYAFQMLIDISYAPAIALLPLCLLFAIINGFSDFIGKILIAEGETKNIFVSTSIGAIICFLVATLLIPKYGLIMAPISALSGFSTLAAIRLFKISEVAEVRLSMMETSGVSFFMIIQFLIYYFGDLRFNLLSIIIMVFPALYYCRDLLKAMVSVVRKKSN